MWNSLPHVVMKVPEITSFSEALLLGSRRASAIPNFENMPKIVDAFCRESSAELAGGYVDQCSYRQFHPTCMMPVFQNAETRCWMKLWMRVTLTTYFGSSNISRLMLDKVCGHRKKFRSQMLDEMLDMCGQGLRNSEY